MPWQTDNFGVLQHINSEVYCLQVPQEIPMSPHAFASQQPPNPTPFDFNIL